MAEAPRDKWRVEKFEVIDSTQEELRRRLFGGAEIDRLVIRAGAQTDGKGQRESEWRSGPGGSYQSLGLRDESHPREEFRSGQIALAVAVAIAEALSERNVDIALKWPNDLFLRQEAAVAGPRPSLPGKVGGILCHYLRGHLLVGVGLNVRNEVAGEAASLDELEPKEVSELVLAAVARAVPAFDPRLPERFAHFDILEGRRLRVRAGSHEFKGRAAGINANGCLLLSTAAGSAEICSGRIVEIDTAASGD